MNDGFGQWRDVLAAVADLAAWEPRRAAPAISRETIVRGRGIAVGGFASSQAGVVAEIEVNTPGRARAVLATSIGSLRGPPGLRVGDPGFEPGASALSERRSNQLS